MQNLRNVDQHVLSVPSSTRLTATAWDLADDTVICAFGPTESNDLLSLKRWRRNLSQDPNLEVIAAWDARPPHPDLQYDCIVDLHHFSDSRTIVLILEGGDIVVVREDVQAGEDAVEIVGSVDYGIAAAAWSPDEELVLIATKSDQLLLMTRLFDSTATVTLSIDDLKVSNHVSVGWGKVETQFKGRGARALRDPTVPEHIDSGTLSSKDDGRVYISWRGDGEYVAVSGVLEAENTRRVIRVLSREGVLEDVSEAVDGQEGALAWKPSGQLIASVRRTPDRAEVIFFERNGLRHGEFDLRLTAEELRNAKAINLSWNSDSSVLAVTIDDMVQFWTSSNYHWYLKQHIRLGSDLNPRSYVRWHPEKALHMASFTQEGIITMQYISQYSTGSTSPPHDAGIVATIDGRRLAVTPLRVANIPPPLAYDEIELPDLAVDVCVHPQGKHIAVLHAESVSIYECDYGSRPAKKARLRGSLKLKNDPSHGVILPRQIAIDVDGTVCVLAAAEKTHSLLARGHFLDTTIHYESLQYDIASAVTCVPSNATVLHTKQGELLSFAKQEGKLVQRDLEESLTLPPSCLDVQVWQSADWTVAFGRTASGQLHIVSQQQQLKITGCTSFVVIPSHLIFTTGQHLLKFVHLHNGQLDIPADEPEKDERCRNVERGAKIVTVVPSTYSLILQMPRGNLETIYPRALVLTGIRQNVTNQDYKKAFLICRSQRVDPNLLYDFAPKQLLADIDLFIKQVKNVTYIDLFLSSLSEEDTTETLYKDTAACPQNATLGAGHIQQTQTATTLSKTSKINTVCDAFIGALGKLGPQYVQSIITAHVSKSPPDLEAGLNLVSQLRSQYQGQEVEQAVEHICFLGDVNRLYDTALGMYDLEVTLLVAQQSQKDPREYLPYLQSLRDMDNHRRRYTIDNDLKRHTKALRSLHALDSFDELIRYVDRHELYAEAVELFRHDKPRLHRLMRLHAEYLVSRNRYGDAGVAFEFVGDYQAAYEAYRGANQWRETLTTAALVPLPQHELTELAQTLADGMHEAKDYASEAIIYLDYLNDLSSAVRLHCKAYNFNEAMRLAIFRQAPQLLEQVVDPGLVECSGLMTELLAEMKTQLNAQIPRLRELRVKKLEEPMAFLDTAENEGGDFPDNLSIAPTDASTSAGTFMTRYTNRSTGTLATNATRKTSKNRRREERKRARGKKGTVYEEEYLVNSITRLIERLNETGPDLAKLVQGLMRRAMRERAVAVETAMIEVEQLCRERMAEVYEAPSPAGVDAGDMATEEKRPQGGEGVLWDTLVSTQKKVEAPVLKAFERLSLLST